MTYEQAMQKKNSLGFESFIEEELTYYVFVTPKNPNDLSIYLDKVRGYFGHLTDEEAQLFTKNGLFTVLGLSLFGGVIVHKSL